MGDAHPTDRSMCVKIIVNGDGEESQRELKYYQHLSKRNISWDMLPEYYGKVETDKGPGDLWELVSDYDGNPSKSLSGDIPATR